jgi:cysteine-rich repeat protein
LFDVRSDSDSGFARIRIEYRDDLIQAFFATLPIHHADDRGLRERITDGTMGIMIRFSVEAAGVGLIAVLIGCHDGDLVCRHECVPPASRCAGKAVQRCLADEDGCRGWRVVTDCARVGQTCDASDGEAACVGGCVGDADCDGVPTAQDCDDSDPARGARAADADCDGIPTVKDCDDSDPAIGARFSDLDCDGVLADRDCDDGDPRLGDSALDADCDGAITDADCDDDDPSLGAIALDADCDGVTSLLDCDDDDALVSGGGTDADCDGASDIVIFRKERYADPADSHNQDCISASVCVTRGDSGGLYNAVSESGYASGVSPAGTVFFAGHAGQRRDQAPWDQAILSTTWWVLQPMVMHVVPDHLTYNLVAFSWRTGVLGGGFSWARALARSFAKPDFADPNQRVNQDCVVPGVCITRGDTRSIFNAASESQYNPGVSPAGTAWAPMSTAEAPAGSYSDFISATGHSPQSMIDEVMSLHILGTDIYYDVVITAWSGGGPGGGFAWERSRALVVGCPDPAAANYDPRATVDDGYCGEWRRFRVPSYPDPLDPLNQDCLSPDTCITRASSAGLFNAARETAFDQESSHSPLGTRWAAAPTADATTAGYGLWSDVVGWDPPRFNHETVSLWIPDQGRFFDVVMLRWPDDDVGGGFTWVRREVAVSATCGNGLLELGEQCDDGNQVDADGCQASCELPRCGDGILDPGEACDLGAGNSQAPDAVCRTDCQLPGCGDGVRDTGEMCDDGNATGGDGCEADCTIGCAPGSGAALGSVRASDGRCLLAFDRLENWHVAQVRCLAVGGHLVTVTDASDNARIHQYAATLGASPWIGLNDSGTEGSFVWSSGSSASYRRWNPGEPNNYGNEDCVELLVSDARWNDACCGADKIYVCETLCGDGAVDPGEQCDLGPANSNLAGSSCRNNCLSAPACGDGIRDAAEDCDDGNNQDGDGCQSDCTLPCGAGLGAVASMMSPTDGSCFLLFNEHKPYDDASMDCQALGGHLAAITTAGENATIEVLGLKSRGSFWIGLTDQASEGTFVWDSGEQMLYSNFGVGEPNDAGAGEDCTEMHYQGFWRDVPCEATRASVCEVP